MKSITQVAAGFGAIGSEEAAAELLFGLVYSSRCRFSSCGLAIFGQRVQPAVLASMGVRISVDLGRYFIVVNGNKVLPA